MNFFLFHQFFFSYLCIPDAEKRLLFIDLEYHRLMKKILFFLLPLCLVFIPNDTFAQTVEADSVDVLHYDLTLDMGHSVDKQLRATADITFRLTRDCRSVTFDLICDSLSPISLDGVVTRGYTYDRDNALLSVYISGGQAGDTHVVSVPYVSNGYVESYGFGGLHMDNNIYYNLGAAFSAYPHVYGRSWYPCRDNFYDKATYRYTVTAKPGWKALCSGIKQSEVSNPDGSSTSVWLLQYPIPTYISSVSSANWHVIERQYESIYGTYPAILGFTTHDSASVAATFDIAAVWICGCRWIRQLCIRRLCNISRNNADGVAFHTDAIAGGQVDSGKVRNRLNSHALQILQINIGIGHGCLLISDCPVE